METYPRPGAGLAALLATVAVLVSCNPPDTPEFSSLRIGMPYDDVAQLAGGQCERVHDRGVRILEWHYDDGSWIEAGIHDGGLSGLEVFGPPEITGRSDAATAAAIGLQADMPEDRLRSIVGDHAVTVHDSSDRECRWTFWDGTLTAIFMRGELSDARWLYDGEIEPVVLAEVTDAVALRIEDLRSEHRWDRSRALQELEGIDDPRAADALLDLLRTEPDVGNRARAAMLLAEMGDSRACDLLLVDLQREIIPDDLVEAMGMIGDANTAAAMLAAQEHVGSLHTKGKLNAARNRILERLKPFRP